MTWRSLEHSLLNQQAIKVAAHNASKSRRLAVCVIDKENQRLMASFNNPLTQPVKNYRFGSDTLLFTLSNIPCSHLTAPHVDNEVEVNLDSIDPFREVYGVTTKQLISL